MVAVLDQTADQNAVELHRYRKLYDFPDYVKKADVTKTWELPKDSNRLPARSFANVRYRQFPCHTKAATWLSYLYFLENKEKMTTKEARHIGERLEAMASYWGCLGDVEKLREKHASLHSNDPLPDDAYLRVIQYPDGTKERHWPLPGPAAVVKAAEWFAKYQYAWPFDERKLMAERLLEKAAEHGCGIPEEIDLTLEKQAGRGSYSPTEAAKHIRNRVKAASKVAPEVIDAMEKLAEMVENRPAAAFDPTACEKLVRTIDNFDRNFGLAEKYSQAIPSPEDIVFAATWKTAKAFVNEGCATTTGNIYDKNDFAKVALTDVRDLFGDDIAAEVADGLLVSPEKMAEVAATFPRNDAQLFDQLMQDKGIRPVVKQATAVQRPTFAQLQQWAKR